MFEHHCVVPSRHAQLRAVRRPGGFISLILLHFLDHSRSQIIGQTPGGPTNEMFAELWGSIAEQWKDEPKVIFGL